MKILRKFKQNATKASSFGIEIFQDAETETPSYKDRDNRVISLVSSKIKKEIELTAGITSSYANVTKLDKTFVLGLNKYDVYSFQSWMTLTGLPAYMQPMGLINVATGPMVITKQSTNVVASDSFGLGGLTNMAISNNSTLGEIDNTDIVSTLDFAYVNQENGLTGVDDNYMFLIIGSLTPLLTVDVNVYVDIEFTVQQGAAVEFINL